MSSPFFYSNAHATFSTSFTRPHLSSTNEINPHTPTNTSADLHPSANRTQICTHSSRIALFYQQYHQESNRPPAYTTCRIQFPMPVHTSTMHTRRPTKPRI